MLKSSYFSSLKKDDLSLYSSLHDNSAEQSPLPRCRFHIPGSGQAGQADTTSHHPRNNISLNLLRFFYFFYLVSSTLFVYFVFIHSFSYEYIRHTLIFARVHIQKELISDLKNFL
jgi:hypothetical protein